MLVGNQLAGDGREKFILHELGFTAVRSNILDHSVIDFVYWMCDLIMKSIFRCDPTGLIGI